LFPCCLFANIDIEHSPAPVIVYGPLDACATPQPRVLRIRQGDIPRIETYQMQKKTLFTIGIGFGIATGTVGADQVEMTLDDYGGKMMISIGLDGRHGFDSTEDINYTNPITAGERVWTNHHGAQVTTYCIQVYERINVGETCDFTVTRDLTSVPESPPYPGAMNSTQAGLIEDLHARFIDGQTGLVGKNLDGYDHDTAAAAFQLVVWEIVNESISEGSLDDAREQLAMDMGAFRADIGSDNVLSAAVDNMLGSLGQDGWRDTGGSMRGLSNPRRQDQLMIVPLPLPGVLAGVGLVGGIIMRRKLGRG